jgi:ankyrin repeat protein/predicted methyltransferase
MRTHTKEMTRSISPLTVLLVIAACVFVAAPAPCLGQGARETWQPPEKIMDAIGVKPGMRIGEAGAGRGYFTFPLARRVGPGGVVFANDISTSSLDAIRERAETEGLANIKIVVGAVEDPLFPEKSLDLVIMVYVLHELDRPIPFLKNLRTYLKPGAALVIIEGKNTTDRAHSPSFRTEGQILETLKEAGYELDRAETFLERDTLHIYKTPTLSGPRTSEIHDAATAGDLSKVRALLEADPALLESKDEDGQTPLHRACLAKQAAVANFLLDKGANVNAKGTFQFTPLIWASDVPGQDTALLQRLIDKGADVNAQGSHSTTPLHRAAFRGGLQVARLLLDHGAEVNVQGYNGVTPLHRAAQSGDLQVARLLIERGADVNAYDKYSGTVGPSDINGTTLQVAINYGPDEQVAKLLVESGARLNRKDPNGNTELHLAALKGYADLTRVLVSHGADVGAVNTYDRTSLYYAAKHGYRSVADALITAGADAKTIVETNYGKAPQLTATLREGEAHIWDLGSHGYAVKTKRHLLIFNPTSVDESSEAGLANGHINPNEVAGLKITVLITYPERWPIRSEVIALAKRVPDVNIVLGYTPTAVKAGALDTASYRLAAPHESLSVSGVEVHAIPAMGGGMGYLVEADGVKVFHAGLHVSGNVPAQLDEFRKEIDFLKPFGPIDLVFLSVYGHNNRVGTAYEPYLYLLDRLSPRAVYLTGANNPEQYPRCVEVLRARGIPVVYPEGGRAKGERFHYLRDRASATAAAPASAIKPPQGTKP